MGAWAKGSVLAVHSPDDDVLPFYLCRVDKVPPAPSASRSDHIMLQNCMGGGWGAG